MQRLAVTGPDLDTYLAINERDVDLVLVMALRAEPAVAALIAKIASSPITDVVSVRHSKSESDGSETDIEVRFGENDNPYVVLIEDKVDAEFQPTQAERYKNRIDALRSDATVSGAASIVIAPDAYLSNHELDTKLFDARLSYEELHDVLIGAGHPWAMEAAMLIEHGIEKHRRGGADKVVSESVTRFFYGFSRLGESSNLPRLPGGRTYALGRRDFWYPRDSTLIQCSGWKLENGSQGAWLRVDFMSGAVVIELTAIARLLEIEKLKSEFEGDWPIIQNTKLSFRMGIHCSPVDTNCLIEDHQEEVSQLIQEAIRMKKWWEESGRERLDRILCEA